MRDRERGKRAEHTTQLETQLERREEEGERGTSRFDTFELICKLVIRDSNVLGFASNLVISLYI